MRESQRATVTDSEGVRASVNEIRSKAAELRQSFASESAASALEWAADRIEKALRGAQDELLGLAQASRRSGYMFELNQVSRNKARRETKIAQNLDQQPRTVAARSTLERQCLFARLDAGFEPNDVCDGALNLLIQTHQKIVAGFRCKIDFLQISEQFRTGGCPASGMARAPCEAQDRRKTDIARRRARGKNRTD